MKLSPHFTLAEFTQTNTGLDNTPTPEHLRNLIAFAFFMEQVRYLLGNKPIIMASVYRGKLVNYRVGGVPNSDHCLGWAGDFRHSTLDAYQAARIINEAPLIFDQLILERKATLIHLSINPRFRRQVLSQWGGPGTAFKTGLHNGG